MGINDNRAAGAMVDLIKTIVRDELATRDQVFVGTVQQRNEADDTYSIYIESDVVNGRRAVMNNIPNESKHIYDVGDHVYVMKVRGQLAQAFIIGSVGARGRPINAIIAEAAADLSSLDSVVSGIGLKSPSFSVDAIDYQVGSTPYLAFRVSWSGKYTFGDNLRILYTYNGDQQHLLLRSYSSVLLSSDSAYMPNYTVLASSDTSLVEQGVAPVVKADVKYVNAIQEFIIISKIPAGNTVSGLSADPTSGVSLMDVGYSFVK